MTLDPRVVGLSQFGATMFADVIVSLVSNASLNPGVQMGTCEGSAGTCDC